MLGGVKAKNNEVIRWKGNMSKQSTRISSIPPFGTKTLRPNTICPEGQNIWRQNIRIQNVGGTKRLEGQNIK
jgi:hypothetical protein